MDGPPWAPGIDVPRNSSTRWPPHNGLFSVFSLSSSSRARLLLLPFHRPGPWIRVSPGRCFYSDDPPPHRTTPHPLHTYTRRTHNDGQAIRPRGCSGPRHGVVSPRKLPETPLLRRGIIAARTLWASMRDRSLVYAKRFGPRASTREKRKRDGAAEDKGCEI